MESDDPNLGSTRYAETAQGILSYTQIAERLAVSLAGILQRIVDAPPESPAITPEWLCAQHKELAGSLFPDWAGRFRTIEVTVGAHTPPPAHKVPEFIRLFCDDLAERLRRDNLGTIGGIAGILAWADWRFQWIHPFKDFNGRIGRVLLIVLVHSMGLPPMDTVPTEQQAKREYLEALREADNHNLEPLTDIWVRRVFNAAM